MIDERILNNLKSRAENPGYCILITGYSQEIDCGQERLIIHLHQINKSLSVLENLENTTVLSKDLIIEGSLDYNILDDSITTSLIGYNNYNGVIKPESVENSNLMSHHVEMVDTTLTNNVDIEFERPYKAIPNINITIDKKYKNYYSDYELDFNIDLNDEGKSLFPEYPDVDYENEEVKKYIVYNGVRITFKKLKRKKAYPNINIAIIGDKID